MTSKEQIILPQGKRKHKIIFKATFDYESNSNELEGVISKLMGNMGLFDTNSK